MAREGHTFEISEETSDADDDFVLESLPDTEELDEEDEGDGLDSEEQPYEAETGFLDTPCSATDGGSSVVGGAQAEVSEHGNEQLRRSKRRKLSTGAAASDVAVASEPAVNQSQPHSHSWQQQHRSSSVGAALSSQQCRDGVLRPPKPRTPLQQRRQQHHGMQLRHHAIAIDATVPAAAAAGREAPRLSRDEQQFQQPEDQHAQQGSQGASQHPQTRRQPEQLMQLPSRSIQQHRLQLPQPSSNPPGSTFTTSDAAAAATDDAASIQDDTQGAICYRTRSKHPLAAEEFDPDMFDRLLAEFDPDVEPLMDDAMYQQFLQSLQGDGPTGSLVPAGLEPSAPGTAAAAAAVAAAAGPGAGIAAAGDPPSAAAGAAGGVQGEDDDESDEEFQLDPLDWLLDDERDAAEEEVLVQLVHLQAQQTGAGQQQQQQHHHAAAVAARRRSQRKAAQRAAEIIARSQQQQHQQQQQHAHVVPAAVAVADGAEQFTPADVVEFAGSAPGGHAIQQMPLQYAPVDSNIAFQQQQQQQQQQHTSTTEAGQAAAAAGLASLLGPSHLGINVAGQTLQMPNHMGIMVTADRAANEAGTAAAAGAAAADVGPQMPDLLTLKDTQLQQLYHQVTLHAQLLTQLYVLTARDPAPTSQAIASSAGQMLEQLRRLHAAATGSYRGQQLAQLLQQAFNANPKDTSADAVQVEQQQQPPCTPQKQRAPWQYGASDEMPQDGQHGGSGSSSGPVVGTWRPAFKDISTVWDTQPLRQLDEVVAALQQLPMPERPIWDRWDPEYTPEPNAQAAAAAAAAGGSRRRWGHGSSLKAAAQLQQQRALKELRQVLEVCLGPHRSCCIGAAWPLLAPRTRTRTMWSIHEDDLMWLGIVRFHTAISPLQATAEVIAQELLPCKTPTGILNRYKNQVKAKSPTAVLLLSYALLGKERPAAWADADESQDSDEDHQQQQQRGPWVAGQGSSLRQGSRQGSLENMVGSRRYKAALSRRIPRGPMWAAAELGAALTVAFAAVQTGMPSAAAAAAAGVLMQDTAASVDADDSPAAAAGAPAAVCAGQQLLIDLVAAVLARLPFGLPTPLDVPSAATMRRQRARHGADRLVAAAAGEHLLLSLAARQLLQGPQEDSDNEVEQEGGHEQSEGRNAAAAAASGSRISGGLGVLLGSVFGVGSAAGAGSDGADGLGVSTAAGAMSSPPAAGGMTSKVRVQATPVKSYVALLQESPLPVRQPPAAAAPLPSPPAAAAAAAVAVKGAKRTVTFALPRHQTRCASDMSELRQQTSSGFTQTVTADDQPQAPQRQQQQGTRNQAEDEMDLHQLLDRKIEQQLQRQRQQAKQQQQQHASQPQPPAMSSMLDGLQLLNQDAEQQLLQPSQQNKSLQAAQNEQNAQGLKLLPSKDSQPLPRQKTAVRMLGNSPTSGARLKQRQQQQWQQQRHPKIYSAREIAQQLQQLQHGQQQEGLGKGVQPDASVGIPSRPTLTGPQQQQHCRQMKGTAASAAAGTAALAAQLQDKQQQVEDLTTSSAAAAAATGAGSTLTGAAAAAAGAGDMSSGMQSGAASTGVKKVRKSLFSKDQHPDSRGRSEGTAAACAAEAQAVQKPVCFGIGLATDSWYQPDSGQQQQQTLAGDKSGRQQWQVAPKSLAAAGLAGHLGAALLPPLPAAEARQGSKEAALPSSSGGVGLSLGFCSTAAAPDHQQQEGAAKPKKKHFSRKFVRTQPLPPASQTISVAAARRFAELTAADAAQAAPSGLVGGLVTSTSGLGGLAGQETASSSGKMAFDLNQSGAGVHLMQSRHQPEECVSTAVAAAAGGGGEPAIANATCEAAGVAPAAAMSGPLGDVMVSPLAAVAAAVASGKGRRVKQPAKGTPHRKLATVVSISAAAGGGQQSGGVEGITDHVARLQQLPPRAPNLQQQHAKGVASHFSGLAALAEAAAVADRRGRQ